MKPSNYTTLYLLLNGAALMLASINVELALSITLVLTLSFLSSNLINQEKHRNSLKLQAIPIEKSLRKDM